MRYAACLALAVVAACRPPASDDYVERVAFDEAREEPREPLASPESQGAIWASLGPDRLVYGQPGKTPYLALACNTDAGQPTFEVTRFAATDPRAKALMALIGNGHISRLEVDAAWNGTAWIWQGAYPPEDPRLEVFTGPRAVEATIPGAGTLKLNPSPRPGELVERCRRLGAPQEDPGEPTAPA